MVQLCGALHDQMVTGRSGFEDAGGSSGSDQQNSGGQGLINIQERPELQSITIKIPKRFLSGRFQIYQRFWVPGLGEVLILLLLYQLGTPGHG